MPVDEPRQTFEVFASLCERSLGVTLAQGIEMPNENEKYNFEHSLLSPYFDGHRYIATYGESEQIDPDDPLEHYLKTGARKGYRPSEFFDGSFYLENNADIAQAGLNPLVHYLRFGFDEGRTPRSEQSVLDRIPSVDISDPALNYKKWRLPCIIKNEEITSAESIQQITEKINATQATVAILDRKSDDWLIVFSGRNEHFYYLNKMQSFWGNILFLRDTAVTYYSQNPNYPRVDLLSKYIDYLTGPRAGRTIVIGQSSGGHAAVYQSSYIKNCVTFGFSPQAYHPDLYTHNIYFEGSIKKVNPAAYAPDLVAHLRNAPDAPRYVLVGKSESSHEDSYYWGDAVSAGVLAGTGKCSVIVVNRKEHPTLQYLDTRKLFDLLYEKYDVFFNDRRAASELFCVANLYYSNVQSGKAS